MPAPSRRCAAGRCTADDGTATSARNAGCAVITPGDNEWTDCHRRAAGSYSPTERLAAFRALFYAEPERSLGQRTMTMAAQPEEQPEHRDFVENTRWTRSRVVFATVHIVGSENDLEPWSQLPGGESAYAGAT